MHKRIYRNNTNRHKYNQILKKKKKLFETYRIRKLILVSVYITETL